MIYTHFRIERPSKIIAHSSVSRRFKYIKSVYLSKQFVKTKNESRFVSFVLFVLFVCLFVCFIKCSINISLDK